MKFSSAEDFDFYFDLSRRQNLAKEICRRHNLTFREMRGVANGEHIVFLLDDRFVIKIYKPFRNNFRREKAALEFVGNCKIGLPVPEIVFEGDIEDLNYLVSTQQKGVSTTRENWLKLETRKQMEVVSQLAQALKQLHFYNADTINFNWRKFIEYESAATFERQKMRGVNENILESLPGFLEDNLPLLPRSPHPAFLHGDVHFGNLLLTEINGSWRISGLLDFADSLAGFHEYEFVAIGVLMIQGQGELQREFFRAYGYADSDINETLRRRLMLLTILYECSDLRRYALRLRPEAVDYALDELERAIWNFV